MWWDILWVVVFFPKHKAFQNLHRHKIWQFMFSGGGVRKRWMVNKQHQARRFLRRVSIHHIVHYVFNSSILYLELVFYKYSGGNERAMAKSSLWQLIELDNWPWAQKWDSVEHNRWLDIIITRYWDRDSWYHDRYHEKYHDGRISQTRWMLQ